MAARKHRLGGLDSQYSREWRINGLMRNGFTRAHAEAVEEKHTAKRILKQLDIPTLKDFNDPDATLLVRAWLIGALDAPH